MSAHEQAVTAPSMASLDISSMIPTQQKEETPSITSTLKSPTSKPPPPPSTSSPSSSSSTTTQATTTPSLLALPLRLTPPLYTEQRSNPSVFGTRHLTPDKHVFSANAWDQVEPDAAHHAHAAAQYALQRAHAAAPFDRRRIAAAPERWWDAFYARNATNFFKDRRWLKQEFAVLEACTMAPEVWAARVKGGGEDGREAEAEGAEVGGGGGGGGGMQGAKGGDEQEQAARQPCVVLEVGAGAGNTAFPLLEGNQNPNFMLHACDFSQKSVQLLREHELFDAKHMRAEVWDLASTSPLLPPGVLPGSVDVVVLIFVFSALAPSQWAQAVRNVGRALRVGGEVCFRDYGRGDLAQVRFRKGRLLAENFYMRGDGTRVFFFDESDLRSIWGGGLPELRRKMIEEEERLDVESAEGDSAEQEATDDVCTEKDALDQSHIPSFTIASLGVDRRLLVNRQKQLKMYRCWMQGSFRIVEASLSRESQHQSLTEQKIQV